MALEPSKTTTPQNRPKRTPLGQRARLAFKDQDPNFMYRIINDKDDRLAEAQEAGYEFVTGDAKLGDPRAAEGGAVDSRISKPVGNGVRGFLMRIPKKFYDEDQAEKMKEVVKTEEAIAKPKGDDQYGDGLTTS